MILPSLGQLREKGEMTSVGKGMRTSEASHTAERRRKSCSASESSQPASSLKTQPQRSHDPDCPLHSMQQREREAVHYK